jgi:hypothetical protein
MFQPARDSDFWPFLRHPHFNDGRCDTLTMRPWIGWVGVIVLADIVVGAIGRGAILGLGHKAPPDKAIMHLLAHPSWMVLAILLLAPILEELTFRAFLSTDRFLVFLGSGMFLAALGRIIMLLVGKPETSQMVFSQYLIGVVALVPLLAAYGVVWWLAGRWIMAFFQRFPAPIFWLSCLMFGAAHSLNFEAGAKPWLILLTLPQISAGIFLGYIRVRHGLRWSIATHMAIDYSVTLGVWAVVLAKPILGVRGAAAGGGVMFLLFFGIILYGVVGLARSAKTA